MFSLTNSKWSVIVWSVVGAFGQWSIGWWLVVGGRLVGRLVVGSWLVDGFKKTAQLVYKRITEIYKNGFEVADTKINMMQINMYIIFGNR